MSLIEDRRRPGRRHEGWYNTVALWGPIRGKHLSMSRQQTGAAPLLGIYERHVADELCRRLTPGAVFYDVGASWGYYSLLASRLIGSAGEVHAFEPNADDFAVLAHNLRENRVTNAVAHELALTNVGDRMQFAYFTAPGVGHLLREDTPDDARLLTVECETLDALVTERGIRPPDVVKVDIEGTELEFIEGGVATFEQFRPTVVMEVRPGKTLEPAVARFTSLGYRWRRLGKGGSSVSDLLFEPEV